MLQVCDTGAYLGIDQILGLCKCRVDDLEEICDVECRLAQRYSISFICPASPNEPFLEVRNVRGEVQVSTSSMLMYLMGLALYAPL